MYQKTVKEGNIQNEKRRINIQKHRPIMSVIQQEI